MMRELKIKITLAVKVILNDFLPYFSKYVI